MFKTLPYHRAMPFGESLKSALSTTTDRCNRILTARRGQRVREIVQGVKTNVCFSDDISNACECNRGNISMLCRPLHVAHVIREIGVVLEVRHRQFFLGAEVVVPLSPGGRLHRYVRLPIGSP